MNRIQDRFVRCIVMTAVLLWVSSSPSAAINPTDGCQMNGSVASFMPLDDSNRSGFIEYVQAVDGCAITLSHSPGGSGAGPGHGFVVHLDPVGRPVPAVLRLQLRIENQHGMRAGVFLQRLSDGGFDFVGALETDSSNIIDGEILVINHHPYNDGVAPIVMKVELSSLLVIGSCQDSEIDYVDDDS